MFLCQELVCEDNEDGQGGEEGLDLLRSGQMSIWGRDGVPGALAHALTGLRFPLGLVFADPTVQEFVRSPSGCLCVRTLEAGALASLLGNIPGTRHSAAWGAQLLA